MNPDTHAATDQSSYLPAAMPKKRAAPKKKAAAKKPATKKARGSRAAAAASSNAAPAPTVSLSESQPAPDWTRRQLACLTALPAAQRPSYSAQLAALLSSECTAAVASGPPALAVAYAEHALMMGLVRGSELAAGLLSPAASDLPAAHVAALLPALGGCARLLGVETHASASGGGGGEPDADAPAVMMALCAALGRWSAREPAGGELAVRCGVALERALALDSAKVLLSIARRQEEGAEQWAGLSALVEAKQPVERSGGGGGAATGTGASTGAGVGRAGLRAAVAAAGAQRGLPAHPAHYSAYQAMHTDAVVPRLILQELVLMGASVEGALPRLRAWQLLVAMSDAELVLALWAPAALGARWVLATATGDGDKVCIGNAWKRAALLLVPQLVLALRSTFGGFAGADAAACVAQISLLLDEKPQLEMLAVGAMQGGVCSAAELDAALPESMRGWAKGMKKVQLPTETAEGAIGEVIAAQQKTLVFVAEKMKPHDLLKAMALATANSGVACDLTTRTNNFYFTCALSSVFQTWYKEFGACDLTLMKIIGMVWGRKESEEIEGALVATTAFAMSVAGGGPPGALAGIEPVKQLWNALAHTAIGTGHSHAQTIAQITVRTLLCSLSALKSTAVSEAKRKQLDNAVDQELGELLSALLEIRCGGSAMAFLGDALSRAAANAAASAAGGLYLRRSLLGEHSRPKLAKLLVLGLSGEESGRGKLPAAAALYDLEDNKQQLELLRLLAEHSD